jgi:hypothetical protein
MSAPRLLIEPNGVYDDALLCSALEVSTNTLADARRAGELRFARKGRRVLYLGEWVMAWLAQTTDRRREATNA